MPKPPPTSWVSTRIVGERHLEHAFGQQLAHDRDALRRWRSACSVCFASSHRPMPERGSSETGASRVSSSRTRSTCAALAKAASSAAALPSVQSSAMLPGRASWIATAPLAVALSTSGRTAAPRDRSSRASDASSACASVSATTIATALADVADAIDGERRHRGREHRLAVAAGKDRDRRDRAKAVSR